MSPPPRRRPQIDFASESGHRIRFEPSPKRIRVMFDGKTVADSLGAGLLHESGQMPLYYFPRADVRLDLLERSALRTRCPYRGDAAYWTLRVGGRLAENAVWSYEAPPGSFAPLQDRLAFDWDRVDHWFEEDEEVFGHARDPYHRIDLRPSSRRVRVRFAGETIADSRRGLFLFETGLPTRYYLPPDDVRSEVLIPSPTRTTCPYKGDASYWTLQFGAKTAPDAVWSYLDPLPECRRIQGHFCFYPEKVEALEVEGGAT